MTKESVMAWLDKQIEISKLEEEYYAMTDENGKEIEPYIHRGYVNTDRKEIFIHCADYMKGGASVLYHMTELISAVLTFDPISFDERIHVSFMYKGYKFTTLLTKKGEK